MKIEIATPSMQAEWVPPAELPDLTSAKTISIDVETRDPNIKSMGPGWARGDGEVVGYAVATADWAGYIPTRHRGGGNLDEKIVNRWLKKVFESPADKIMHNAQYDMGWIRRMGFDKMNGRVIDTMVVASLLDENRFSYSLNALCYEFLGIAKNEKLLTEKAREFGYDPKADMWKMPAMYVGPYAQGDAEITLKLWEYLSGQLSKENLWSIANLELDLLPCLVDMTWRGVRVDQDKAEKTRNAILKREKAVLQEIKKEAGMDVEVWAAASISKAFDKLNIPYDRTEKGAPSFKKQFLAEHSAKLPKLIVEARNLNKTSGTFINNILKFCNSDGRIHSHINQIRSDDGGTVSGRFSMNNPNLQQIPARDPEIGPLIRSLFLPEEGEQWASIDYSQQEPRILVHYASVFGKSRGATLRGVEEFVETYNENPRSDFHDMVAEMAGIPRKQAKTIGLGLIYGMGVTKLADQLGLQMSEAKKLVSVFHDRVPFVKGLMNGVTNRLNDRASAGSIHSILGRKCRFDLWEPDSYGMTKALPYREAIQEYGELTRLKRAYTYKALNRLIQASAADMTKQAMVNLYKEGYLPMLQIHDELAMSVKTKEEAKAIAKIMQNAVPLDVPILCDVEMGPSWGEAL
jgi:DNA polymerase I-like protein with 3'-5' exonuclease and polymerase domains|tara:strand:- start:3633 stop:5528 length:1896 start_codon:yes stop_codon:yes gene_type:complete